MNLLQLQTRLRASGRYLGNLDGLWGTKTSAAVTQALSDGPDTTLHPADFLNAAVELDCDAKAIEAVTMVEASGAGFQGHRALLLFEPHRFSKATGGRYDASHPGISQAVWNPHGYPAGQDARYAQLLEAVSLDVDAGFASASYGRFQILGENFAACGFASSFDFAEAMAHDETTQLLAFIAFIKANHMGALLAAHDWTNFALRYNGTAARLNNYAGKLARAYQAAT